ncbi:hypothetical protein PPL_03608 [Heterostelium album PN500]|uniref:AP-5 complex subunit beta-1 n=1 Tax=Heterostelium pallidum (strain ATCC 26659 / Pp 5 / PN500) TaxID=670386 RepID=D3B595_HETP5|nr:hypothetical protein PPL_03608 [Heterostelium album PN500]EFA83460.1 hypothetical protein PPL_03608 [Heterostelium album PN500]|eukprot:XP_020435577.1 hypothetical protein PPL_03608 [Heterostelium album PN500]
MDSVQAWTANEWYAIIQGWRVVKPIVSSSANAVIPSANTVQQNNQSGIDSSGVVDHHHHDVVSVNVGVGGVNVGVSVGSNIIGSVDSQKDGHHDGLGDVGSVGGVGVSTSSAHSSDLGSMLDKHSMLSEQDNISKMHSSTSYSQSSHASQSFSSILTESNILNTPSHLIIEILLKSLKFEKDDILRINLLLFLQENSTLLLEEDSKRFERVFSILQSLVNSQVDSYPVKSQVLSTMTTILICESIIKTHPRLVETFIDLLLDIVNKINNSSDRLLRGSACQCLLELELTYPCLLSPFIPTLLKHVQNENTHLIQCYTQLFTTILQHAMVCEYEELINRENAAASAAPTSPIYSSSNNSNSNNSNNNNNTTTGSNNKNNSNSNIPSNQSSLNYRRSLSRIPSSANIQTNIFTESSSTLTPISSFAIPQNIKYSPISATMKQLQETLQGGNGVATKLSDNIGKELLKCISVVVDQSPQLNQWGLISVILQLVPLVDLTTSIPPSVFKHPHLYKLFFIKNPLQFHLLLFLALKFPDIYSNDEFELFFKRLIFMINDISLSQENRILAIDWLLSIPNKRLNNSSTIYNYYKQFYPTAFDNLSLKEVKLYAMCKCILDNSTTATITNQVKTTAIPPNDLLKSLICLDEFRYHQNENSIPTKIVFSILLQYLISFPTFKNKNQFIPIDFKGDNQFETIEILGVLTVGRAYCTGGSNQSDGAVEQGLRYCATSLYFTQHLFKPLRLILTTLSSYFCNLEIRDRAKFYDRILTHLPDDKIKPLLTTTSTDESNISGMGMSSLSTMKIIKSLNNHIAITPIKDLKPILHQFNIPAKSNNSTPDDPNHLQTLMVEYQNMIREYDQLGAKIVIPYRIRYKPNIVDSTFPQKVYALLIQFRQATTPSLYSNINPIRIPYLCYNEKESIEFPYCFDVDITFIPHHPLPSDIRVKMVFNDDEGKTCKAAGAKITVEFQDLFMTVPIPPSATQSPDTFKSELFEKLWKMMIEEQMIEQKNPLFMHSVKHVNVNRDIIKQSIAKHLKQYIITGNDEKDHNSIKVLIFLPPQHHLLLIFEIGVQSTIVHIKTDYWRSLAYIDPFLSSLVIC